jgi:hypothetical protein
MKISIRTRLVLMSALLAVSAYGAYAFTNTVSVITLVIVGILALDRTTWLPFLGETVMPVSLFKPSIPSGARHHIEVVAPPRAQRVVYWASNVANARHPSNAYAGFTNAGVTDIVDGVAVMNVRMPYEYSIRGRQIPKHVHYRFMYSNGLLSEIMTTPIPS